MNRTLRGLLALALVLAASGCGTAEEGAITLGALYPTSGSHGPGGIEEARGARLAVELVNSRGGVHGRPVRVIEEDVATGEAAPAAVERMREQGVDILLGTYGSTVSAPAAAAAASNGMVLWETGAVGNVGRDAAPGRSFFRAAPTGQSLGAKAVAFVEDVLPGADGAPPRTDRPLRYAIASVEDAYGEAVAKGAVDEVARRGLPLAGWFRYDPRAFDETRFVADIAATKPDVLFVAAYLEDGVALRKATVASRMPLVASVGTSSSYCMREFGARLGADAVGLFASDKPNGPSMPEGALSPAARAALRWAQARYRAEYHDVMTAAALAGFANAWGLLGYVLPRAGGLDAASVARAARRVQVPVGGLPNGAGLDFGSSTDADAGANRRAVSVIWEWVAPRQQAVVWPSPLASRRVLALPVS